MAEKDDNAQRFIADGDDMAIGIGPSGKLRFIGMGLLAHLKDKGLTETEIYARIPATGRAAMNESQLKAQGDTTAKLSVWDKALGAIDPK